MKPSAEKQKKEHHEKLWTILKPLGFIPLSAGWFYDPYFNIEFDLTASSTEPPLVIQNIMQQCMTKSYEDAQLNIKTQGLNIK